MIEVCRDPPRRQGIQCICGEPDARGPQGFRGPWGQITAVLANSAPSGPNITMLDTTGLETSFQAVGDAMNQIAQQQQIANVQFNQSLQQQQQERNQIVAVMERVANATLQCSYDNIFASIPVYDVSDTKEFWSWLHCIESVCSFSIPIETLIWKQWEKALESIEYYYVHTTKLPMVNNKMHISERILWIHISCPCTSCSGQYASRRRGTFKIIHA